MMRPAPDLPVVYLCREAVDFRKGLYALAVLVESQLKLDPFSAQLFAFRNRRATAVWPARSGWSGVDVSA